MSVAPTIGAGVAVIGLITGLFTLDARYQHKETAKQELASVRTDSERDKLQTDLDLATLEIKYQLGLPPSTERDLRLQYLKDRVNAIQRRLDELRSAK